MPKADFPIESIAEEEEDANAMQKAQSQQAPPRAIEENGSPLKDANHEESQDEMPPPDKLHLAPKLTSTDVNADAAADDGFFLQKDNDEREESKQRSLHVPTTDGRKTPSTESQQVQPHRSMQALLQEQVSQATLKTVGAMLHTESETIFGHLPSEKPKKVRF